MKRYLIAAALAVLALSQVNADNTGRAFIRTAEPAPATAAPTTVPTSLPPVAMAVDGHATVSAGSGCSTCNCASPTPSDPRIGLHPFFSKLLWWKKPCCKKCGGLFGPRCHSGHGFGHGQPDQFNPYPNGVPGTLVFPQHPFVRSPRDFWMWEAK